MTIRLETPADYRDVENLTREAFWNVYRPGCTEHYVLNRFRDNPDFIPELDFVMEEDGRIIGHVMFSKAELVLVDGTRKQSWTFGPISIDPEYKRKRYGIKLLRYALGKAREMGVGFICMEGNIDFYKHAGFGLASRLNIHYHDEPVDAEVPYFLAQELIPGWLKENGIREATYTPPKGAYRGKVGLWYGQKFNDKEVLAEAVKDLKTVIDSDLYDLVPDMFIIERQAGDFCEEYLFEHNSGDNDGFPGDPSNDLRHTWTGWPSGINLPKEFFGGWGWNAVSKEFGEFLAEHEGNVEKPRFKSTIHTYEQVLAMDYAPGVTPGMKENQVIYHNAGYFTFRGLGWLSEAYEGTSPPFWKWYKASSSTILLRRTSMTTMPSPPAYGA